MVKSIISIIVVAIFLTVGAIYENNFIRRQFNEFSTVIEVLYEKVNEETATTDDVYAVQSNWVDKKRFLHAFIPHNEIKEMELWLAETIMLVRDEKWTDAVSKIEVLKELSEQIPKTFVISWENIL